MILGTILLAAGFIAALAGAIFFFQVIQGNRSVLNWARVMAYAALVCALLASVLLLSLILARRYDIAYVYQYTSEDLPFSYRLSAFWAGQQGSFLLWLLLGSILAVLQIRRSRQFEPYVLLFMLLVQVGLTLFLLVDSPFRLLEQVPLDGFGMNPLLQNPWMVSHPPILFVGYAGLALPFAYALAGLWRRDYDEWVARALPWTLCAWFFLGFGIYLGAYWAYETLGWGGYWGWDLVENSSLIPWLTGTALLHGMLIQRYRRRLRHGNFMLALATFLLVLYATYMTRSGVLSEVSTHSFVESDLSPWMMGLLLAMIAASLALLVSRWTDIPKGAVLADSKAGEEELLEGDVSGTVGRNPGTWFSRDLAFLLAMLLLLLLTTPILVGTLVPMITRIGGLPDVLDIAFYPRTTAPFLALLLAVLSLCPLLGWRESSWERLRRFLTLPALLALLAVLIAVLVGARRPLSLLFILLGAFALASNAAMLVRTVRGGFLRLGGYLAHVGLGLLVIGIVASSVYSTDGATLGLQEGRAQETLGYSLTFVGWQETPGAKPSLRLIVERDGGRFTALPELYINPQDNSLVATPHVQRYLTHDLYIAPEGYDPAAAEETVSLGEGQTVSTAGYSLTLQGLRPGGEQTLVVVQVESAEGTAVLTPTYPLEGSTAPARPVTLPGGEVLTVEDVYLPPPGLILVVEGTPAKVGPYMVSLREFYMNMHDDASGVIEAGVVIEFAGPAGVVVVTPTQSVGGDSIEAFPVELWPGVTVQLVQMAVEQRAAQVQVEGLELERQLGYVWLQVQSSDEIGGVAWVHVSVKPGMNLLWLGGILLLSGTLVALVRRWREGERLLAGR